MSYHSFVQILEKERNNDHLVRQETEHGEGIGVREDGVIGDHRDGRGIRQSHPTDHHLRGDIQREVSERQKTKTSTRRRRDHAKITWHEAWHIAREMSEMDKASREVWLRNYSIGQRNKLKLLIKISEEEDHYGDRMEKGQRTLADYLIKIDKKIEYINENM